MTVYASSTARTAFSGIPNQFFVGPVSRSKSSRRQRPFRADPFEHASATAALSARAALWNRGPLRPMTCRNQGNSLAGTNDSALLVASKISRRS